jgi:hypothetical protein
MCLGDAGPAKQSSGCRRLGVKVIVGAALVGGKHGTPRGCQQRAHAFWYDAITIRRAERKERLKHTTYTHLVDSNTLAATIDLHMIKLASYTGA